MLALATDDHHPHNHPHNHQPVNPHLLPPQPPTPSPPSSKALGKRPIMPSPPPLPRRTEAADVEMAEILTDAVDGAAGDDPSDAHDASSSTTPATPTAQDEDASRALAASTEPSAEDMAAMLAAAGLSTTRQKRIMPSRSRRGAGPGVGNCDVDLWILNVQKQKAENEPLVPASTPFMMTTDSALVASSSSSSATMFAHNPRANERYFERPDILKSYRDQLVIQTPEFYKLDTSGHVGGRFRPRQGEEVPVDLSDAAYEKRHRKYEAFEKRVRMREKEKLKHEQYKLKERIDQLRAMDATAFLSIDAASFSTPPKQASTPSEEDGDNPEGVAPVLHTNGSLIHNEGERRRQEMLENATVLEERYNTLTQDRKQLGEQEKRAATAAAAPQTRPPDSRAETVNSHGQEADDASVEDFVTVGKPKIIAQTNGTKIKFRFPPKDSSASSISSATPKPKNGYGDPELVNDDLQQRSASAAPPLRETHVHNESASAPFAGGKRKRKTHPAISAETKPWYLNKKRGPDGRFVLSEDGSPSVKRVRQDSGGPPTSHPKRSRYTSTASGPRKRRVCLLMLTAERSAGAVRKATRKDPFGAPFPPELDNKEKLERDFEIPDWVHNGWDDEDDHGADDEREGTEDGGPPEHLQAVQGQDSVSAPAQEPMVQDQGEADGPESEEVVPHLEPEEEERDGAVVEDDKEEPADEPTEPAAPPAPEAEAEAGTDAEEAEAEAAETEGPPPMSQEAAANGLLELAGLHPEAPKHAPPQITLPLPTTMDTEEVDMDVGSDSDS